MPTKATGPGTATIVTRWNGGFTWMAHPEEAMQLASHALVLDDSVWLVDPVDCEALEARIAEHGHVAGIVLTSSWHSRDAARLAAQYDVPIHLHSAHTRLARSVDGPIERFDSHLAETAIRAIVIETRLWTEIGLYYSPTKTLIVGDSLVTRPAYTAADERLAVFPIYRRLSPPIGPLTDLSVNHVLVGHGVGITDEAQSALDAALRGARWHAPMNDIRALPALIRSFVAALRE